eukprot:9798685-Ditylum_brightwellii.AAC.1
MQGSDTIERNNNNVTDSLVHGQEEDPRVIAPNLAPSYIRPMYSSHPLYQPSHQHPWNTNDVERRRQSPPQHSQMHLQQFQQEVRKQTGDLTAYMMIQQRTQQHQRHSTTDANNAGNKASNQISGPFATNRGKARTSSELFSYDTYKKSNPQLYGAHAVVPLASSPGYLPPASLQSNPNKPIISTVEAASQPRAGVPNPLTSSASKDSTKPRDGTSTAGESLIER